MSLLTPERVPVKVYRWDDIGAPQLDKTANCMTTIFNTCLVTGYGTKEGAGWTMPFEDAATGIKVFKPAESPKTDFYLRCSSDTGLEMIPEIRLDMTSVDNGVVKLKCDTAFKYGFDRISKKWILIATAYGFWFLFEGSEQWPHQNRSGGYLYCGLTGYSTAGNQALYLQHTGGSYHISNVSRETLFEGSNTGANNDGKAYIITAGSVHTVKPDSYFKSTENKTVSELLSAIYIAMNGDYYELPVFASSKNTNPNYTTIFTSSRTLVSHATGQRFANNFYIATDYWEL